MVLRLVIQIRGLGVKFGRFSRGGMICVLVEEGVMRVVGILRMVSRIRERVNLDGIRRIDRGIVAVGRALVRSSL